MTGKSKLKTNFAEFAHDRLQAAVASSQGLDDEEEEVAGRRPVPHCEGCGRVGQEFAGVGSEAQCSQH